MRDKILERIALYEHEYCNRAVFGEGTVVTAAILQELYSLIGGFFDWKGVFDRDKDRRQNAIEECNAL